MNYASYEYNGKRRKFIVHILNPLRDAMKLNCVQYIELFKKLMKGSCKDLTSYILMVGFSINLTKKISN